MRTATNAFLKSVSAVVLTSGLALGTSTAYAQNADSPADTPDDASTALTIYSSARPGGIPAEWYRPVPGQGRTYYGNIPGYAVVKEERPFAFDKGVGELRFTGVAALLDPTTVSFISLDDEATKVLEQDYRFDLVSNEKLFERFIDEHIRVTVTQGSGKVTYGGKLLSSGDGIVLLTSDGSILSLREYDAVDFPSLPGALLTKPTLVWTTFSPQGGEQDTRLAYQTTGITWWADYNLVFTPGDDANSGTLEVGAWVSILNQSGGTYEDAKLKLVAGDVNRARSSNLCLVGLEWFSNLVQWPTQPRRGSRKKPSATTTSTRWAGPRPSPTTRPSNSNSSTPRGVPVEKVFVYDGAQSERRRCLSRIRERRGQRARHPAPAGTDPGEPGGHRGRLARIRGRGHDRPHRARGRDHDQAGQLVRHRGRTPGRRGEPEHRPEGHDPDDRGQGPQPHGQAGGPDRARAAGGGMKWKITQQSHDLTEKDATTIEFPVTLDPDEEEVVTYSVRYTW